MLNRIMLRPNAGDHVRVSILEILRALGEHCSWGLEANDHLRLPTVTLVCPWASRCP